MLRVLTLSTLFPDASRPNFGIFVERQLLSLVERDDVEVRVISPRGIPPWPLSGLDRYRALRDLPERERWKGLEVHRPTFLNLPRTGGRFHAAMLERAVIPVIEAIRGEFPFDLIAAEFFFPDGPAAVALGRRYDVPVSIKARGSDVHFWGHAPHVAEQVVAAGQAAHGMFAVSEAMRDDMIALGMPGERIDTITTGIDLKRFHPRDRARGKRALKVQGPLVVSLGALIPLKGHDIVIDAVAGLPGVNLWIAGQGPEEARLAAQIERLGIGDRVRLLGGVHHNHVPLLVAAADVMALASEREGLANAWMEAVASGTPIVIPNVGGARQVVQPGTGAGRLVERDADAFARGIAATLADPPDAHVIRRTVEGYSWAANSATLQAHYAQLVAGHRADRDRLVAAA